MKKIELENITTEGINQRTKKLDQLSSLELVKLINQEDKEVAFAVEKVSDELSRAIDLGVDTLTKGGRIIYLGAGTSGRLGVLDASELPPTYNFSQKSFFGIIAGGIKALTTSLEGVEDDINQAKIDLKKVDFKKEDLLVGISASGRTPYVKSGLEYVNKLGGKTIAISTSKNSEIGKIADIKIEAIVGPETITGSTRMKSGTAQKLILNTFSSGIMIKLGKVYGNLMIDLQVKNQKLFNRGLKILEEITKETDRNKLEKELIKANYSVRIAAVMIRKNLNKKEALSFLKANKNDLRSIIEEG